MRSCAQTDEGQRSSGVARTKCDSQSRSFQGENKQTASGKVMLEVKATTDYATEHTRSTG